MWVSEIWAAFVTWTRWCSNSLWFLPSDTTCCVLTMERVKSLLSIRETRLMTICFIRCRDWLHISNFQREMNTTLSDSVLHSKNLMDHQQMLLNKKMPQNSWPFSSIDLKVLSNRPPENISHNRFSVANTANRWSVPSVEKLKIVKKISISFHWMSRISNLSTNLFQSRLRVK